MCPLVPGVVSGATLGVQPIPCQMLPRSSDRVPTSSSAPRPPRAERLAASSLEILMSCDAAPSSEGLAGHSGRCGRLSKPDFNILLGEN